MSLQFETERMERLLADVAKCRRPIRIPIEEYRCIEAGAEKTDGAVCSTADWPVRQIDEPWKKLDGHRWYRTTLVIPEEMAGQHVVFTITTGREGQWDATNPQMLVYVDGEIRQGADVNHRTVQISGCAENGRAYEIALLAYSGSVEGDLILHTFLETVDDRTEAFYYDFKVPLETVRVLKGYDDENAGRILKKLAPAADVLDLRIPYSREFYRSLDCAGKILKEAFYSKRREDVPFVYAIGHTHIDIAWLWTVSQTKEKVLRSFSTVLELMERYPDYKFMSSQPILYQYVKEQAPEMYERIKEKVREGRWEIDGAMWLEADCNLPCGEALVRQVIKGERFFREEFGIESQTLWLPDVFGYSAAIPQILKKSGIPYFMTTKIAWNQYNQLPNDTFWWKGIDGSRIFVFMPTTCDYKRSMGENISFSDRKQTTTYTGIINPNMTLGTFKRFQNRDLTEDTLMLYGYGDGGGGPTAEMLEYAERLKYGMPGLPRLVLEGERPFFDKTFKEIAQKPDMPVWDGELYFEYHRGTLTSMGKNKRYNRKSEILYEQLETLGVMGSLAGAAYPEETIRRGWDVILLNQFHDIIPGSAIEEVYRTTDREYEQILTDGEKARQELAQETAKRIAGGSTEGQHGWTEEIHSSTEKKHDSTEEQELLIFNTLGMERTGVITAELPYGPAEDMPSMEAVDAEGNTAPVQTLSDGKIAFLAENLPPAGIKAYRLRRIQDAETKAESSMPQNADNGTRFCQRQKTWDGTFENTYFRAVFNDKMELTSLVEMETGQELLKENRTGNELMSYEDRPMNWDNWDIDCYYKKKPYPAEWSSRPEILEQGPVRTVIQIRHGFAASVVTQKVILYADQPRIDFQTEAEWKEHHVLLRVNFPADVNASKASYEIQYGNVERETTANHSWDTAKFEVCGHKWADVSDNGAGLSLLNDCKYGYSVRDGEMGLTLIKSGVYPNPNADIGHHEFTYSIYPHKGRWQEARTIEMAYDLNVPLFSVWHTGGTGKEGLKGFGETGEFSLVQTDAPDCFVEVFKQAEDGNGYILRVYENQNRTAPVTYTFGFPLQKVWECDLQERVLREMPCGPCVADCTVSSTFRDTLKPFEIKTYRVLFSR